MHGMRAVNEIAALHMGLTETHRAPREAAVGYAPVRHPTEVTPWGTPPTPLLPRWYLERLASRPIPQELRDAFELDSPGVPVHTVQQLALIWNRRNEPVGPEIISMLVALAESAGGWPPDQVVISAGAPMIQVLALRMRTRTRNCLLSAYAHGRLREGHDITVRQLWAEPNFGVMSLLDLMCLTEAAGLDRVPRPGHGTPDHRPQPSLAATAETGPAPAEVNELSPDKPSGDQPQPPTIRQREVWKTIEPKLLGLLAAAVEFRGARTLAEALRCDLDGIAGILGLRDELEGVQLQDLCEETGLADEFVAALAGLLQSLPPIEQSILRQRIYTSEPVTLEAIARTTSVTRERIRQIQKRLEGTLRHSNDRSPSIQSRMATIAGLLRPELAPVITEPELEAAIRATFPEESEAAARAPAVDLARNALRAQLGYTFHNGFGLNEQAVELVENLRSKARGSTDDAGLVDEGALRDCLPHADWEKYWDVLVDCCSLHRLGDHLSLRDSAKARAKAALLQIGKPATKEEVAELSGLALDRVGAQLSVLPSIVRADKRRWGLAEWIDDEYEGIAAEIIQRINEDGGATRLTRVLDELPRKFGVSESSVRAYAGTPRFLMQDGYVSIADPSSITLRSLDHVVDGRTADGSPYWCFEVEDRYLDGYSIVGVPPEIVKALGCEPDGNTRVPISSPAGCRQLSAWWPLSSLSGASIGYLADPLSHLGASAGDRVCLAIKRGPSVSLSLGELDPSRGGSADESPTEAAPWADPSTDRARATLERMKNRRRGF